MSLKLRAEAQETQQGRAKQRHAKNTQGVTYVCVTTHVLFNHETVHVFIEMFIIPILRVKT